MSFAQALKKVSQVIKGMHRRIHTFLDELEPINDVALIGHEDEPTFGRRLAGCGFRCCDFRSKLDASTDDTTILRRISTEVILEIGAGVSLTRMCSEGASILCILVIGEIIAEVVVLGRVGSDGRVIFSRCDVDRGTYIS